MKVGFRVDASIQIGTGHVMRCLTLADALKAKGAECIFICREHPGHMIDYVRSKGYAVYNLPMLIEVETDLAHGLWLGATQTQDAKACKPIIARLQPDWLVVDHYALDTRWESALAPHCKQLMVIDDLADRQHSCQILLDQTFGRDAHDYQRLTPNGCTLLCGSNYALLRPEFKALREYSLRRRVPPQLKHILITLGGVDKDNATSKVLAALRSCTLPNNIEVAIIMGAKSPWLKEVREQAQSMPWPTTVHVGANNIAQLMADADLAIGAAGATTWERCCLGLPTIMVVLAENQKNIAKRLSDAGGAVVLEATNISFQNAISEDFQTGEMLRRLSQATATIVDGCGASRVVITMLKRAKDANKYSVQRRQAPRQQLPPKMARRK